MTDDLEDDMTTTNARRKKAQPPAPAAPTLELEGMFRPDSKAMQAAKLLMSGQAVSRTELAETFDVAPTTIPRVLNKLEAAGAEFERTTGGPSDKEAIYKLRAINGAARPDGDTLEAKVLDHVVIKASRIEWDGDTTSVWASSPLGEITAKSTPSGALAAFAQTGLPLSRVFLLAAGRQSWVLGTGSETVVLTDLEFVE